ncbi:MAG: pyruvate dehydrogenase (acetyl-transferring) E1 component subunit alpha [Sphingomonadales bacterium]
MARTPPAKPPAKRKRKAAAPTYDATSAELLEFYRTMLLLRRFEEKAGQMYGMGLIGGFCHLYIGQEAIAVGMKAALSKLDNIITSYRDHGHLLAADADPKAVMAELTGRIGGISRGKGGSMHMFDPDAGFYGGHGIVGAQVPIGTGLAFSHQYRNTGGVSVVYFGDGAANQGQVYEAFNMAELWCLPVLFVIENNQYAMGTSVKRSSAQTQLSRRGDSFGIHGIQVDGMNVLEVKAAADEALAWCRAGKGPRILEMKTYRYRGHSMSDPAKYRSREEVQKMRAEHDPIDQVRRRLIDGGHTDEAALKEIDRQIKAVVAEAAEFAQSSPEPDPEELYADVVL